MGTRSLLFWLWGSKPTKKEKEKQSWHCSFWYNFWYIFWNSSRLSLCFRILYSWWYWWTYCWCWHWRSFCGGNILLQINYLLNYVHLTWTIWISLDVKFYWYLYFQHCSNAIHNEWIVSSSNCWEKNLFNRARKFNFEQSNPKVLQI